MAIASVSTITSASPNSWQEAAELGLERARQTLRGITGMKVVEEKATVEDGEIVEYRVTLQVIFLLEETEVNGSGG
ncbi:MAG: dodecin family protein [Myxococcota bacterium]